MWYHVPGIHGMYVFLTMCHVKYVLWCDVPITHVSWNMCCSMGDIAMYHHGWSMKHGRPGHCLRSRNIGVYAIKSDSWLILHGVINDDGPHIPPQMMAIGYLFSFTYRGSYNMRAIQSCFTPPCSMKGMAIESINYILKLGITIEWHLVIVDKQ